RACIQAASAEVCGRRVRRGVRIGSAGLWSGLVIGNHAIPGVGRAVRGTPVDCYGAGEGSAAEAAPPQGCRAACCYCGTCLFSPRPSNGDPLMTQTPVTVTPAPHSEPRLAAITETITRAFATDPTWAPMLSPD